MTLLDSHGRVLVQSDGLSPGDTDDAIDEHLSAGTYFLQVESISGAGTYNLAVDLTPAAPTSEAVSTPFSPSFIATGDFNRDGITDLAVASYFIGDEGTNTPFGGVTILLGIGDGTFRPGVQYAAGNTPYDIVTGDFNGDGNTDLAVADSAESLYGNGEPGGVTLLLGNGDGTFRSQATTYPVVGMSFGEAMVAADFNGDGRSDLAVATSFGVSLLLSNGDGSFKPSSIDAVGYMQSLVVGDFNGDGHADLAGLNAAGLSVLLGNGDGTFAPAVEVCGGPGGRQPGGWGF